MRLFDGPAWRRVVRAAGLVLAATSALGGCATEPATGSAVHRSQQTADGCPAVSAASAIRGGSGAPLTVTFHGVSTLVISDGRDRILVDGFFSRPDRTETLLRPLTSNADRVEAVLDRDTAPVRAVLVAHAHHDHVMDVGVIVDKSDMAVVVGDAAVVATARAQGVPSDRLCLGADGAELVFGAFTVTPLKVQHGPGVPIIGRLIDREMRSPPDRRAWLLEYVDPENLSYLIDHSGRRLLVHPSAGTRDLTAHGAQVVFLGVGRVGSLSWPEARAYFSGAIGDAATLVAPVHWDDFTSPPTAPLPTAPSWLDDVSGAFDHLCRFAPKAEVARPDWGGELRIDADGVWRLRGPWIPMCGPEPPRR